MREPAPPPRPADLVVVAALVVAAGVLRAPGVGPSSLWLDDAWVALVAKASGVGELLLLAVTAPGFVAVLRGIFALLGAVGPGGPALTPGFELAAQAVPLVCGLAAPAVLYLVAVRRGLGRAGAAVGAATLVAAPVLVVYSVRVKHYTVDALFAVVLVWLAWRVVDDPADRRAWWTLGAVAVGATFISAGIAPVAGGAIAAGIVAALGARAGVVAGLVTAVGYASLAAGWVLLVLVPRIGTGMYTYWDGHYVRAGEGADVAAADAVRLLGGVLEGFSALPVGLTAAVVVAALLVTAVRRPALAVVAGLPPLIALGLAAMEAAPLGTGRTDAYLYPGLALAVAVAVDAVTRRRTETAGGRAADGRPGLARITGPAVAVVLAGGLVAATWVGVDAGYPEQDIRPLVVELERRVRADDLVLVYPSAVWAYALYTSGPVEIRPHDVEAAGFRPVLLDPRVAVLGRHRAEPELYRPEVAAAVAGRDRVWMVASHISGDIGAIERMLVDEGFAQVDRADRPGARLTLWERR